MTGRDVRLADAPLTEAQAARLESLCLRREAREPLQYLCGRWSFLDFELIVGPGVLCPVRTPRWWPRPPHRPLRA